MKKISTLLVFCLWFSTTTFGIDVKFETDKGLPLVYLSIAIRSGAVADPQGKSGLTNFVGQMLMRGTRTRAKEQIDIKLDELGSTLQVETQSEAVILRGVVLSNELDSYLKLVTEILTKPKFSEKEINKLKNETLSEIASSLDSDRTVGIQKFQEFLFDSHPYSHLVTGKTNDIKTFTRKDIVNHYEKYFQSGNISVVGTGDALPYNIENWAQELEKLRPGEETRIQISKPNPVKQTKVLLVDKPARTQAWIYIGQVGIHPRSEDYIPLYIANSAFGSGFNSRLMKEIRVKRGWSYGAASTFQHGSVAKAWFYYLFPASKVTPQALKLSLDLLKDLKEKGLTKEEFEFTKDSLINSDGFRFDTAQKRSELVLTERLLNLPSGFLRTYREKISSTTLNDVNRALKEFIQPEHLAIVILGTASELREKIAKELGVKSESIHVVKFNEE